VSYKRALPQHLLGNKSLYLKNIYYCFCEGPIKVIHYYQIELQDALATNYGLQIGAITNDV
jgi:hypothetical protein